MWIRGSRKMGISWNVNIAKCDYRTKTANIVQCEYREIKISQHFGHLFSACKWIPKQMNCGGINAMRSSAAGSWPLIANSWPTQFESNRSCQSPHRRSRSRHHPSGGMAIFVFILSPNSWPRQLEFFKLILPISSLSKPVLSLSKEMNGDVCLRTLAKLLPDTIWVFEIDLAGLVIVQAGRPWGGGPRGRGTRPKITVGMQLEMTWSNAVYCEQWRDKTIKKMVTEQ